MESSKCRSDTPTHNIKRKENGKVRSRIKILGAWLTALLMMSFCPVSPAAAKEETSVIKVAFPESPGVNEVYADGTYGGCVYDWLEEIAKYTGWNYEFVTGDANELTEGMRAGEYDLMGGMLYTEGFDEYFNYPKYVMGSNYNLLICRQDNPDIKGYDYTTLNGKRVGVFKNAAGKIARLEKFLDFNNIQCELVYYDDVKKYEKCLETGEADLLLGSDVYMKENYNVAAQFEADPWYLVTAKAKPELCEELSEAMELIYSANPNFATELYEKYFPDRYVNSLSFTEEERALVRQSGPLKVAVIKERYPLYYEQDGVIKGIVPECLELISQRTGLTFEYVYTDTYQGLIDLVTQGKADIIGGFRNGDTSAVAAGLVRTAGYAYLDSVILRNKNSSGKSEGLVMAVSRGQDLEPNDSKDIIRYYEKHQDCIDAVNSGEADYTRMPAGFIEDFFSKDYYPNITLIADTNLREELTLALPLPVNVPLYSVLSKALNSFSERESLNILTNNTLTLRESSVSLKTLLYTNPMMVIGISVGIILLISVIVILLGFYRMRTKVMRMKLEKAVETSRAKSDFLSRMSHEIRTPMNAIIGLTNLTRMSGESTPKVDRNLAQIDSSAKFLLSLLNDVLDMSKIDSEKMKIDHVPFDLRQVISQIESMFAIQIENRELKLEVCCNVQNFLFIGDKMRLQQVLTNLISNACKFTDKGGNLRLFIEEQSRTGEAAALRFSVRDTGIGIRPEELERIFHAFEQAEESNLRAPGTGLGLAISRSLVRLMGGELQVDSEIGVGSEFFFTIELPIFSGELPAEGSIEKIAENRLEGLRVLLAEDNDLNAEIVMELLKLQKMTVERAVDGRQAVERFSESPEGFYDMILMDINMPVKDGLAATAEIRAMNRADAGNIPILAMTANTFQEDRDKAAAAGMTGFLPKPFDVHQLYRILLGFLGQNRE